jgi:hypothetical protein
MGTADDFDERWDGAFIPSCHWHLHRRLFERYRVVLAPGEFSKIMTDLRKKRAHLVEKRKKVQRFIASKYPAPVYTYFLERTTVAWLRFCRHPTH